MARSIDGRPGRLALASGAALLLGLLGACSTPTPYQPAEQGFGFAEARTGPKNYRVAFTGNWMTRRQTVHKYVLYRAAELAEEQGYRYVGVEDASQIIKHYGDLRARPTNRLDFDLAHSDGGNRNNGRNDDGGVREQIEFYQAVLDVALYRDRDRIPAIYREVYEADQVLAELGPEIDRAGAPAAAAAPVAKPPVDDGEQ
jgi:hypothetical protein